ncbi:MAG TPA: ribosomal L7Ae/L30e/S12e/Gadd45 family protein [Gemmatimonadaceae bacterium]|nr:ribosomal L7Ae/L30e/S12e/Gadd45 family protein [Gemmatimonadaceae bacterium]
MNAADARKLLGLIGLGVRGRGAIVGVQQVREAARRGKLQMAIAAPDASRNSLEKVLPLLRARGIIVVTGPSAAELGSAVGREATAVVGIVDRGLAKGIRALSPTPMLDGRKEELG